MTNKQKLYLPIKRIFDISISLIAFLLILPLLIVIAIVIKLDSNGPVFFKQKRMRIDNTEFYILQFRTMRTVAPKNAPTDQLNNAASWITKSGRLLRKTSLDELTQLVNIIKGEMSIVGSRPSLWNQYNLNHLRINACIHHIKPGLTGWAQVNGRDENNDEEKVKWDTDYLENFSFSFDVNCILKTILAVFKRKGVIEGGLQYGKEDINNREK